MKQPDLSICILSYNTCDLLQACLQSLFASIVSISIEVLVVDNHSTDGTLEMLRSEFPDVRCMKNPDNLGYTRAMNQGLRSAVGRYLVQLNPDTIVQPAAFDKLHEFMEAHPAVGIVSPKVLNSDGSFQYQCRRSAARPWDVVSYFTGLWRLFPRNPIFGRYLMTYKDVDEIHPAEAVSGSCMVIRRDVVDQIGYLDEAFFAYQEDTDFCFRARQKGWQVYYAPVASIIHYGGHGGSRNQPYRAIIEWHKSYLRYYRKHLASDYVFLINWLMYAGMGTKLTLALIRAFFSREKVVGTRKPQASRLS